MESIKGPGEASTLDGSTLRIGIIHARWNTKIISALLRGTIAALRARGVKDSNIVIQSVPGSYELPYAVSKMYTASQTQANTSSLASVGGMITSATTDLLGSSSSAVDLTANSTQSSSAKGGEGQKELGSTQPFDAIIAIGALIKGSTMHFEYISDAVSHGLMKLQLDLGVPVIFGLLTLLTEQQGLERAGIAEGENPGHNHGEDWGNAAVELGAMRAGWAEGRFVERVDVNSVA